MLTITKRPQTITFTLPEKYIIDTDFEPEAAVNTGLPLTYISSNTNVAEVYQDAEDGNKWKIRIIDAGTSDITVHQAGNEVYAETSLTKTLTVLRKSQTITFAAFSTKNSTDPDFELTATVNTGLPLTYTSSNTDVAEVYQDTEDGNKWKVRLVDAGTTNITAIQEGNHEYNTASLSRTLTVSTQIMYVKAGGTGNGTSWANATGDLQTAINALGITQVWVAKGTYISATGTLGFAMRSNVAIYGGFPDTGKPRMTDRNWQENPTILSGNNQRTAIFNNNTFLNATAVLDGFILTNCYGTSQYGAIFNNNASPAFNNLIISNNTVNGVSNLQNASPVLTNVIISGNKGYFGGIYNGANSAPVLTNVTISGNNSTADGGGGIYNASGLPMKIRNSIIWGNGSGLFGSGLFESHNSLIQGITVDNNNNPNHNIDGSIDPGFVDAPDYSTAPFAGGNYALKAISTVINAGDNSWYDVGKTPDLSAITKDIAGNARIKAGKTDIGAYEFQGEDIVSVAHPLAITVEKGTETSSLGLQANLTIILSDNSTATAAINWNFDNYDDSTEGDYVLQGTVILQDDSPYSNSQGLKANITVSVREGILPVTLIDYTAKAEGNSAKLQWHTSSEIYNKEYIVSRSTDGINFMDLAKIPGKGNNNTAGLYSYYDKVPNNGINYYRLSQVDYDGKISELGIRTVNFGLPTSDIRLYPNPTNDVVNVLFEADIYNILTVADVSGKVLQQIQISSNESSLTVSLGDYPAGTYLLRLSGSERTETKKIVKK